MAHVLFDQGTPVPLRKELGSHRVETARERGWSVLGNGDLLHAAEEAGSEVLVTTDQNLRYQQNLASRSIAIVVLSTTSWPRIQRSAFRVRDAVDASHVGSYTEVPIG